MCQPFSTWKPISWWPTINPQSVDRHYGVVAAYLAERQSSAERSCLVAFHRRQAERLGMSRNALL